MARRAAEGAEQTSPQSKRITRARTKGVTNTKKDCADGEKPATTSTTTGAKRGRPRTKNVGVSAKGSVNKGSGGIGDEEGSSEDEVDVVTVRTSTRGRPATRGRPPGSGVGRGRKPATTASTTTKGTSRRGRGRGVGSRAGTERTATQELEESDDDDDELAQLDVSRGSTVRGKSSTNGSTTKTPARGSAAQRQSRRKPASSDHDAAAPPRPASSMSSSLANGKGTAAGGPKKKVTFLDFTEDSDKENVISAPPVASERKGKSATGITAKPVRGPAASNKPREQTESDITEAAAPKEPLSPKKPTQVAKSGSSGSSDDAGESDDTSGQRTAARRRSRSPTKLSSSMITASPPKKIDFGSQSPFPPPAPPTGLDTAPDQSTEANSSPAKEPVSLKDSLIGSSAARRPPASPFKGLMKSDSPKKASILLPPDPSSPSKDAPKQLKSSPLKDSPKKIQLPSSSQMGASSAESPFKEKTPSLLLTPAKRPVLAPTPMSLKSSAECESPSLHRQPSAEKNELGQDGGEREPQRSPGLPSPVTRLDFGPARDPLPEPQSPDRPMEESVLELAPPDTPQHERAESIPRQEARSESPCRSLANLQIDGDDPFVISEPNSVVSTPRAGYEGGSVPSSVDSMASFRGVPPPAPSPPVFTAVDVPPFTYREEIDESDAESVADPSPTKRRGAGSNSPGSFATNGGNTDAEDLGFTPLAAKLSEWKAASPDKQQTRRYPVRGQFSPVKKVPSSNPESRAHPRDSLELEHARQSLSSRPSLAPSTPTLPRFFQEEENTVPDQEEGFENNGTRRLSDDLSPGDSMDCDVKMGSISRHHEPGTQDTGEESNDEASYGDENAAPEEPTVTLPTHFFESKESGRTFRPRVADRKSLPMSVTPVRRGGTQTRAAHTVSKVPIRPDGDGDLQVPRNRRRSLFAGARPATPTSPRKGTTLPSPGKNRTPLGSFEPPAEECQPEELPPCSDPQSPEPEAAPADSPTSSPAQSPTKSTDQQVLQGAVVFADVHTAEGADASGIFVELLTQMGARCVRSWGWNPRASLSPVDGVEPRETKVGITHVVYKDGGVRTLEKVREANGVVKCVGVGWVLDCERHNEWLDEAEYSVDISIVPRGGQKRRKSMEPRALSNLNGSVIKLDSSTGSQGSKRLTGADQEAAVHEFRKLSPPSQKSLKRDSTDFENGQQMSSLSVEHRQKRQRKIDERPKLTPRTPKSCRSNRSRRYPAARPTPSAIPSTPAISSFQPPATPSFDFECPLSFNDNGETPGAASPTTPFYLSERNKLIQQTCPPKQLQEGLFDKQGALGGCSKESIGSGASSGLSEGLKARLEAARRKSTVWRPKVGSPLAK